ncbi:MAG: hypothetical protein ACE15B_12935 [Bryobacteraceae bacterium]
MFERWGRKRPLTGAPGVCRRKTYAARSGYVYQYCFEGRRELRGATEYVFHAGTDGKSEAPVSVLVRHDAVREWERVHGRALVAQEKYAAAKLALFQAFDERPAPALMRREVVVRAADMQAIFENLGID